MKTVDELFEECAGESDRMLVLAAQRDAIESAAKIVSEKANECDNRGLDHFCELFGCGSLDELAAKILELKP